MTRAATSLRRFPAGSKSSERKSDAAPAAKPRSTLPPGSYFRRTELPLTSLAFLLPIIVLYEIGTQLYATDPHSQTEQRIIAFSLLQRFLLLFGANVRYLPAAAVPAILIVWHLARRDSWKVKPAHVFGMIFESLVLAIPLLLLGRASERYLAHITLAAPLAASSGAKGLLVLSLGAGVYEELLFRLIVFALLSFVFTDFLAMKRLPASLLMVAISGVLFACYHYLGNEPFRLWTFAFRTLAGMYFGAVFLCRGFGVTAGCHVGYDLCVVSLRAFG
ncbi:CPBP family glutamic-type intramembrane protease [soil metagenome]